MISIYKNKSQLNPDSNVSILDYINGIKEGKWQDCVFAYRNGKIAKNDLPAATISGVFANNKKAENLVEHSGYICIDIDSKDQIAEVPTDEIAGDEYTFAMHQSASGNGGYVVIVRIDPKKHKEAFEGLQKYYLDKYNIVIDKSCSNVNRLRYVSYDPDLFYNEKAKIFKKYLLKKERIQRAFSPPVIKSDFDEIVQKAAPKNLFEDYHDYIKLAFALAGEFGASGEDYFHALCQSSSKYNYEDAKKDYKKALGRDSDKISKKVTIGSIYYMFKNAGIEIVSERTKEIKKITRISDNPIQDLKEKGIDVEPEVIEKFKSKEKNSEEESDIDLVIELIKLEGIKFNEIKRTFEFKGEEMNDRILAEFYTKVWKKVDDSISKDKIFTLIQNRENTKSYNPIHDWFGKNKNIATNREFEKLKNCFQITHEYIENGVVKRVDKNMYLDIYLKKWLVSLIASAYGTYSLMILVLNGEQGTNKTKFFRNLLPRELRNYYAESNLDEGKDSEILMTKKWLIVDDEFGGKSKKDATKLKRLSSQQTFSIRMPYGRTSEDLMRLAVLGGTSNDYEVINDITGNRRVIPINIESFNFELYNQIDKDKLFVELYWEYTRNTDGWFLTKDEVEFLNKTTLKNQDVQIEEELIITQMEMCEYDTMTCSEITMGLVSRNLGLRTNTKRVGMCLKKLGFDAQIKKLFNKTARVYKIRFKN